MNGRSQLKISKLALQEISLICLYITGQNHMKTAGPLCSPTAVTAFQPILLQFTHNEAFNCIIVSVYRTPWCGEDGRQVCWTPTRTRPGSESLLIYTARINAQAAYCIVID